MHNIINKIDRMKEDILLGSCFLVTFLFEPLYLMINNITYEVFSQGLTLLIQVVILTTVVLKLRNQVKNKKK